MAKTKATPTPSMAVTDANGPVLVIGATGSLGQRVIQQLRQANRAVRAYVRTTTEADEIELTGAQAQIGALIDQPRLSKAIQGISGILWTVEARPGMNPADLDITEHKGLRALIAVLEASGATMPLVVCSAIGTLDPESNPPLAKMLEAKRKAEIALEDTKLPYTIVRPGGMTENPGGGGVLLAPSLGTIGRIARADVATIMIAALARDDARGKIFEIINKDGAPKASEAKVFAGLK